MGDDADSIETGFAVDTAGPPTLPRADRGSAPAPLAGPLEIGQQFGARYHILKQLGIGGMGAVYQAWDAELGVAVALKVIRPEVTRDDPAAAQDLERRFKQELLLARQVTHKNVVRIHDLGEIGGIKYITMSFIDGDDLASVMRSERLTVRRVVAIAREIASGLQAAHDAGVVHRDLKPANVMIEKEHAIIMDFGIARSTSREGSRSPANSSPSLQSLRDLELTRPAATIAGQVVGTIEYMAPEQARGEHVDQRADIYAFGLIVYDMLVGERRVMRSTSAIAELQARLTQAPPPVRSLVPIVPDALASLVARCVEPDAAKRFQTTGELVAALDWLTDDGRRRPIRRVVGLPVAAAVALVLVATSAGVWWYQRQFIPPPVHDPVSVIIADFQNNTNDPSFNHTLEPMVRRALEDAGFITAYDRNGIRGLGVPARAALSESDARELAVQQGLGVVMAGSIDVQGGGYRVSLRATQTVAGSEIASEQARAANKDDVLDVATRLVTRVRSALGDETSASSQQFAMASISATSFDVVRLYAAAMEAAAGNRFDEARQNAQKAIALDPNFGIGYLIASVQSRNLGNSADERKYLDEALRHLDGMTERERYHVRGSSYLSTNDYKQCVKEFGEAVAKYPADVSGRNQLALCQSHLRQMQEAVRVMREVVKILPGQPLFRDNLALYANYGSDFQAAEQEARAVPGTDMYATLALAFSQLGQGQLPQARATYESLAQIGRRGPSYSASGLGDLATLEGRFSDAVAILEKGAADNLAMNDTSGAAAKLLGVAYAELSRGRLPAAIAAAESAVRNSQDAKTRFLAARTFVEAGDLARARPLRAALASELYDEPRAYAKMLDGLIALKSDDARQAVTLLREANELFDTWLGLFDLGRASLAAGLFAQADSAFDACLNARRGEALSLFVDEQPTYAYLAPVHYYLGRAREGLNSQRYAESYRQYLTLRGSSKEDPLLPDVRRRAGE